MKNQGNTATPAISAVDFVAEVGVAREQVSGTILVAAQQLVAEITSFFRECWPTGYVEKNLGRVPSSMDLVPFFQTYAERVFDSIADHMACQILAADESTRCSLLVAIMTSVVRMIRRDGGVWEEAVTQSAEITNLGGWFCEYGEYGIQSFAHPHCIPIRAAMEMRAITWRTRSFQQPISAATTSTLANLAGAPHHLKSAAHPNRAKWLEGRRLGKGWSISYLADRADIDEKTIRRVRAGKRVHEKTLISIAAALGITAAEIPDD